MTMLRLGPDSRPGLAVAAWPWVGSWVTDGHDNSREARSCSLFTVVDVQDEQLRFNS